MPEDNPQTPQALAPLPTLPTLPVKTAGIAFLIPVLPVLGIPLAFHALAGAAIGGLTFTAASMLLGPSRKKMPNIPELFQGMSLGKSNRAIESAATPKLLFDKSPEAPEVLA